jgi:hypothetical protein
MIVIAPCGTNPMPAAVNPQYCPAHPRLPAPVKEAVPPEGEIAIEPPDVISWMKKLCRTTPAGGAGIICTELLPMVAE